MKITNETTVTIHYSLTEKNGPLLEKTEDGEPVTYLQGLEMMLPKLEEALEGKIPGDKVSVEICADDAFGDRIEELVLNLPKADFESPEDLELGGEIIVGNGEEEVLATVTAVNDTEVTLDGNHPYAGKDLIFDVEVVEVHKTTDEDLKMFSDEHEHDEDCDCGQH